VSYVLEGCYPLRGLYGAARVWYKVHLPLISEHRSRQGQPLHLPFGLIIPSQIYIVGKLRFCEKNG